MLKLMDLLTEGVYDKGIFKAVFMAGGPGSGKTFMAKNIFGIPKNASVSVSGLQVVNSDKQFMYLLRKHGFDPTQLATYPDKVFNHIAAPMKHGGSGLRDFAQDLRVIEKQGFMRGKLGMIIDSTGSNFQKVKRQKKMLEEAGYDTYMVFVMTSLETALQRNKDRAEKDNDRELPKAIVTQSWKDTRKNLGGLKALFGKNFALVHNDKHLDAKAARHAFANLTKNYANRWLNSPIQNPKAKQWVKDMLRLKKAGVKK